MTTTPSGAGLLFVAANPSIDRLIELPTISVGTIHRPDHVIAVPGGKSLNSARAALALGGAPSVVGFAAGFAGAWIAARLKELRIPANLVRSEGETRTCVSILDRSTGSLTEFYERGEPIGPSEWTALEDAVRMQLAIPGTGAVAFSGSLPPGAPDDGYARLGRIANAASVPILVDAYGRALDAVLSERPAVVKINASEATDATGLDVVDVATAVRAAELILARGASRVVITLGLDGAVLHDGVQASGLGPPLQRGLFPVGSGDTFFGGLAVAHVARQPFEMGAVRAMAAAVANSMVPGAATFDASALDGLMDTIQVDRI